MFILFSDLVIKANPDGTLDFNYTVDCLETVLIGIEKDVMGFLASGETSTGYFCNAAIITDYLAIAASTCFDGRNDDLYIHHGSITTRPIEKRKIIGQIHENTNNLPNDFHLVLLFVSILLETLCF